MSYRMATVGDLVAGSGLDAATAVSAGSAGPQFAAGPERWPR